MKNSKLTIAISGFSGTFIAEPGGSVAGALRKVFGKKIKIVALAYSSWANGLYSPDLVDEIYLMQPLNDISNHYFDLLRVFKLFQPDIYIPTLELEVKYLRYFLNRFRPTGPKALVPEILHYDKVSKLGLHYFCHDQQFLYPKTIITNNYSEFSYHIVRTPFPCLIKSVLNGATLVNTIYEAHEAAQKFSHAWQSAILIQEYIAGDQYMVASLFSANNKTLRTLYARKHLVNHFGKSAITVMVDQPELKKVASQILDKLDWCGPLELEFIKTADNYFYLFEINPRFPSWIDIASSIENNLPALLVNYLQKKQLKKTSNNISNDVLLRDVDEVCVSMTDFHQLQTTGHVHDFDYSALHSTPNRSASNMAIGITGVSSLHLSMPGLSIAKALKNSGTHFTLICLAESYQDTGCYRHDLFDRVCLINMQTNPQDVLKQIKNFCKTLSLQAIIPTLDRHVEIFIAIEKELLRLGIKTLLPSLRSLQTVYQFPAKNTTHANIVSPKSYVIKNIDKIPSIIEKIGYPVVLKVLGADKSCLHIAYTVASLETIYNAVRQQKKSTYLLQQFIEGEHFSVFGIASKNNHLLSGVVIKAMQTCVYGKIWMATRLINSVAEPFLNFLSNVIRELKWEGPIEIDCIRDKYDEKIYCIDINPRFPSWSYYACVVEPDLLKIYVRALLGIEIKNGHQKKNNYMYVRLPKNYFTDISTLGKLISGQGIKYSA